MMLEGMGSNDDNEGGNWKQKLRFLHSLYSIGLNLDI